VETVFLTFNKLFSETSHNDNYTTLPESCQRKLLEDFSHVPLSRRVNQLLYPPVLVGGSGIEPESALASISTKNGFQSIGPSAQFHVSGFEPFFPLRRRVCCHYTNNDVSIVLIFVNKLLESKVGFAHMIKLSFTLRRYPLSPR
jgi:hypothetical protein